MRQLIEKIWTVALLALGLQSSWAYSLGGPIGNGGDAWQVPTIGYGLPGDLLGPKNLGEEYRRDIPVLYYSYDANFLDYFASNGTVSVDAAFAILNNSFTYTNGMATNSVGVDGYSPAISEFPLETRQTKYEAQALGLFDMKSFTLGAMAEQMGLAEPERYTWTLHDRFLPTGTTCPSGEEYLVVQRNYDITSSPLNQLQYSPYVNNTLYTYIIEEFCTVAASPFAPALAISEPLAADPLADQFSPVADFNIGYGDFYTGLTRDDVAGLRYQLSTNNVNFESPPAGSLLLATNVVQTEQLLTTVDLNALLTSAVTNAPATLQTLFPGLVVASSTTTFTVVSTPNIVSYLTNPPGAPYGTVELVVVTNGFTRAPQTNYSDVFANVITNGNLAGNPGIINGAGVTLNYSPNTTATVVTTSLGPVIGAPYGSPLITNTTVQSVTLAGTPSGEFFVIPAGQCGWQIVPTPGFPIASVVMTTNVIGSATNTVTTATNTAATNNIGFVATQTIVTSFTNHTYVVEPIICSSAAAAPGLYQGIGKVKFVRADFDSLLGQFFQPVTNYFSKVLVTNSQPVTQYFQRVVTAPDFTFSAADMANGPAVLPGLFSYGRNVTFDQTHILPGLAGPGVIDSPTTITFDKVGPVYYNDAALGQLDGTPYFTGFTPINATNFYYAFYFVWAQFDGSTNEPAVFPDGTSIANLENEVLVQITPGNPLHDGATGVSYAVSAGGPVTFTATGGAFSPPFTWSWTPASSETLPPGLALSSGGTLSGIPTQSGTFDFTVQLTDSLSRSVQWPYSITIH